MFNLTDDILNLAERVESHLTERFAELQEVKRTNFYKVLGAMQKNHLSERHFAWQTGYGYHDAGRDVLEAIFSDVFKAEDALVRTQIVNGTHALSIGLNALLRPGDHMLSISGPPYDSLHETIGIDCKNGSSLIEQGCQYSDVALNADGSIDVQRCLTQIRENTVLIYIQRSAGYNFRKALRLDVMAEAIRQIKQRHRQLIVMVDNCYGEFIEKREPLEIGANLIAGSLIKNPGGGLALSGGYLAGDRPLIEKCAHKLTAPGIGKECGLTFGQTRSLLQGLYFAPDVVMSALKGAIFAAAIFEEAGYQVAPRWFEPRSDIIQSIKLGSKEKVIAFCQAIQRAAPVDAHVIPQPWPMPGYRDEVIMAAGAFVQGSSIELSADAPIRQPYDVFLQGGLTYDHARLGAMMALQQLQQFQ